MNRIIVIISGLLVSHFAYASAPIESIKLNSNLAKDLGFIIEVTRDKEATNLSVVGPKILNNCVPMKIGSAILNQQDLDVAVSISEISKGETPKSFGYIRNISTDKLVIFIDYICPVGRLQESRRYELWSSST
jgi:hypothetical protein|tara:strand:+ start:601 stop:999 length:399 start_codon:yes stop_codon:yes gene_type:complete